MLSDEIGLSDESNECWPENWIALQVFCAMSTQWNVITGAYIGLRYEALPIIYKSAGIEKNKRAEIFESLRIMENEALSVINKR